MFVFLKIKVTVVSVSNDHFKPFLCNKLHIHNYDSKIPMKEAALVNQVDF